MPSAMDTGPFQGSKGEYGDQQPSFITIKNGFHLANRGARYGWPPMHLQWLELW